MYTFSILELLQFFVALCISFLIVYRSIPVLIEIAYHKNLYDKPDGQRKVHADYITNLGGISIFIAFITAFLFSGLADSLVGLPYFVGASLALFFCGLKDDLVGLSPKTKLIIEALAALVVVFGMGLSISQFGGVFGVGDIPVWLAYPISLFTMIVVINAYNLIDGIDGLAGGVAAIASITFGIGFLYSGDYVFGFMAILLAVTCISYLFHNFYPASIFMGDTGSLVIGFLLSIFSIRFISLNEVEVFYSTFGNASIVIPIAALSVPLYDTLRVFSRRIARKQSPFTADADHIHHTILKMGWGQKRTVVYLYFATALIIMVAFITSSMNVNLSLILVISSMLILLPTIGIKRKLALALGFDLEKIFSPKRAVDMYHHLTLENKRQSEYQKTKEKNFS